MEKSIFLKILIIGESGVGKTSFLTRFLTGKYEENIENSLGTDYQLKIFHMFSKKIKVQFWDILGNSQKFSFYICCFSEQDLNNFNIFTNINGIVMICEYFKEDSIKKVIKWKESIEKLLFEVENRRIPMVLVANKSDLLEGNAEEFDKIKVTLEEIALKHDFFKSFFACNFSCLFS